MSVTHPSSSPVNAAGSSLKGEPAFLAVGKLRHAHGVHGEILMEVYTDFPERIQPGIDLFLEDGVTRLNLTKRRSHQQGLLLTFLGYTTPEAVGQLRNLLLYVRAADRPPLADGEYYQHQLIGLEVVSDVGETIGVVSDILETGATDVLVVRPESGQEVLIPMADDFVKQVNLAMGRILVHLIPGIRAEET
jgi:16S rRNA processing protein RimM